MIIGTLEIDHENASLETHRNTYLLRSVTLVSVQKPFLAGGILFSVAFIGFAGVFADIMRPEEIAWIIAGSTLALLASWQIGRLRLLSRELKGADEAVAIWGRFKTLNGLRREIATALRAQREGADL